MLLTQTGWEIWSLYIRTQVNSNSCSSNNKPQYYLYLLSMSMSIYLGCLEIIQPSNIKNRGIYGWFFSRQSSYGLCITCRFLKQTYPRLFKYRHASVVIAETPASEVLHTLCRIDPSTPVYGILNASPLRQPILIRCWSQSLWDQCHTKLYQGWNCNSWLKNLRRNTCRSTLTSGQVSQALGIPGNHPMPVLLFFMLMPKCKSISVINPLAGWVP